MLDVGLDSISEYQGLLEADVDEFTTLFNTILINLTGFFRDPAAWTYLESEVLPEIIARRQGDQPIRIWSAGCATGEEPYSLAMAMANRLGIPETARPCEDLRHRHRSRRARDGSRRRLFGQGARRRPRA